MTVKVLIWRPHIYNNKGQKQFVSARVARDQRGMIGHASLSFDDDGSEGYVSWVPYGTVTHNPAFLNIRALYTSTAPRKPNQTWSDDYDMEGGAAQDYTVTLSKDGYGLSDAAIGRWWKIFNATGNWRTRDENCSTVAMTAMRMGGSDIFYSAPSHFYWDPMDVYHYAMNVQNAINLRWRWLGPAMGKIREDSRLYPGRRSQEDARLWTSTKFKKESDAGTFSHRYALLKEIDRLLDEYHTLEGKKLPEQNLDRQIQILETILLRIHEQSLARPDSKRKKALFTLGEQAMRHHTQLVNHREELVDVRSPIIGEHVTSARNPSQQMCSRHPQWALLECPEC